MLTNLVAWQRWVREPRPVGLGKRHQSDAELDESMEDGSGHPFSLREKKGSSEGSEETEPKQSEHEKTRMLAS